MKKRYRFIFDFSRRSPKDTGTSKRTGPRPGPSDHYAESDEDDEDDDSSDSAADKHSCYCCGATRSSKYHENHPLRRNKMPRPSLCTRCRFYRRKRLENRARDGSRRRHIKITKTEARADEREWCGDCGVLRSNKYHAKLESGEPPNDFCGDCIIAAEKKARLGRLRVYCDDMDMADGSESEKHDPLRDSLFQRRRSSPYALTPTFPPEEFKLGSRTTSASSFETQVGHSDESGQEQQSPATTASETTPASCGESKASEPAKANIRKTTVENDTSEDGRKHAQAEQQVRQESRETRQPQKAPQSTQPGQQEKRHELPQQPELKPRENTTTAPTIPSAPQVATSDTTKQRQEVRQPEHKPKAQAHEAPVPLAAVSNNIQQRQEVHQPQPKPKAPIHEGTKPTAAAPTNIKLAPEATETRDYFNPRNFKRPEPRETPAPVPARTTSDNTAQRQQETHKTREHHHGHKKQLFASSIKPPRAQEEPFYFRNPNPARKSEPKPKPQAQPKPKQQQQPAQPTPSARPMGVSDMYWASTEGQAETEQTFTAGGIFFSAGMYDAFAGPSGSGSGSGSRAQQEQGKQKTRKTTERTDEQKQRHRKQRGFGASSSSSSRHHKAARENSSAAQVWEVDSDEAEEIEQERVRLLGGGGKAKGKARRA